MVSTDGEIHKETPHFHLHRFHTHLTLNPKHARTHTHTNMAAVSSIGNPLSPPEILLFYLSTDLQVTLQQQEDGGDPPDSEAPRVPTGDIRNPSQFACLRYQNLVCFPAPHICVQEWRYLFIYFPSRSMCTASRKITISVV